MVIVRNLYSADDELREYKILMYKYVITCLEFFMTLCF